MKKIRILIPTLIATASMPLISLVSCGEKSSEDSVCEVEFQSNGGSYVNSQKVNVGEKVTRPTNPTRENYIFDNWYTNRECTGEPYDFETPVTAKLVLYAKWIKEGYSVILFNPKEDGYVINKTIAKPNEKLEIEITSNAEEMTTGSLYTVTVGDVGITNYTFTVDQDDQHIATLTILAQYITGDVRIGLTHTDSPIAQHFDDVGHTQDSWETVCYYANLGIDALKNAYGKEPEEFIGLTRTINLNGYDHKVRVVGINQDYTDKDSTKPVTLTFQFESVVSGQDRGIGLEIEWNSEASNQNYWESTLENALNSEDNDVAWYASSQESTEHRSVQTIIKDENKLLMNNIKSVYRGVNVYDETIEQSPQYHSVYKPVKIFIPTFSNLFSTIGINTSEVIVGDDAQAKKDLYCQEGQLGDVDRQYQYYAQPDPEQQNETFKYINDHTLDVSSLYECLCRKDCFSTPAAREYWLSSPTFPTSQYPDCSWYVSGDGGVYAIAAVNQTKKCVAPCFCI
ncbi:MAG: InlB B-repeat-containing protein [Mycoplasmoidaceae bacterium]